VCVSADENVDIHPPPHHTQRLVVSPRYDLGGRWS
jgi:hypothetical protein